MSNTKWEELRLEMHALSPAHPRFQVKDRSALEPSSWEGEWFYHFRGDSYKSIEWVDICATSLEQRDAIRNRLRAIHVPGIETETGFRVFGYIAPGQPVAYIA